MTMEEIYIDAFIPHEESTKSEKNEEVKHNPETTPRKLSKKMSQKVQDEDPSVHDPRATMDESWTTIWKFQPLWMIRNYFGEKIALYFAWTGMLTSSLWLPTLFGTIIFLYGLSLR